jgi:hypothetical protein|tara:strand:- start:293 stop:406 length:114 start_codon:yes stop_codon:yes gene_type:complete
MKKILQRLKNRVKFYLKEREHKKKLEELRKKDPFIYD